MPTHRLRALVALATAALVVSLAAACTSAGGGGEGPTINHIQVATEQTPGLPVAIEAQVADSDGIESVAVFYQAPHAGAWNSAAMALDATRAGTYTGEIPGAAVAPPSVSYYLEATDKKGVTTRLPANAPTASYSFAVTGSSGDAQGPSISHVKVADNRPMGSAVTATATVTDATGVASVVCKYRAQGATDWTSMTMTAGDNDKYTANFPITAIIPDAVEYYLEAVDTTALSNRSTLPLNAPDSIFTFTVSAGDETPPVITHAKIADGQPEGRPAAVVARVEDLSGIKSVTLFYRTHGATTWEQLAMTQADASSPFTAIIPAATATTAGVDYYIEAVDNAPLGNAALAPDTAPDVPYFFTTAPETCIAPPLNPESFEAGIFPGWWRTYSSGAGCEWKVTDARGHDGSHSADHTYGTNCNDLLVLACLDLTGLETEGLVLDFWQRQSSTSANETHTLEWAANNPDPGSSTYAAIGSPIPQQTPTSSWGSQKIIIPPGAPMLGQNKVYFAFRYRGNNTWTWSIDEVRIRPPGPAIELSHLTASPNPVTPGTADVSLNVTLRNSGDGPSAGLTGTLTTTDPDITITTPGSTFAGVAAGGATTSATPFHVAVGAGHATGAAPLKLQVTDGSRTYDVDISLYVGPRATAHIVMMTASATWESDTELYLGVGLEPATPDWIGNTNIAGTASSSGTKTYDVDLTAQAAWLPPSQQHPWFLKVLHKYSGTLEIQEFSISYGATSYSALGLPWVAADGSSSNPSVGYVMVPKPPQLEVETVATTPATLTPNTSNVQLTVTVRNVGSATQGGLTGTLTLKAPTTGTDVSGLTPTTPVTFAAGSVGTGSTVSNGTAWTFNVTSAHNDGSPLHFNLALNDATAGLTWNLPVDVPVPWPGVSVVSWSSSATGDGNYLPDQGETADLTVVVQNTGTGATAGQVTGTLSVNPVSTGLATVTTGLETSTFGSGPLAEGAIGNPANTFRIVMSGSATPHHTVYLDLTLTDGTNVWVKPVVIPLYQKFGGDDPSADAASNIVDLRWGFFNCDDTTMEVRLVGWSPFAADAARTSVIIADAPSGPGHAVKLSVKLGELSAYTLGATTWETATLPASLTVTPASGTGTALIFRVSLADLATLGLTTPKQARLGLQSETSYSTSDYFPDAWGTGHTIADLVSVTWP